MVVAYVERPTPEGPLPELASEDGKRVRLLAAIRGAQQQLRGGQMPTALIVEEMGKALRGMRQR